MTKIISFIRNDLFYLIIVMKKISICLKTFNVTFITLNQDFSTLLNAKVQIYQLLCENLRFRYLKQTKIYQNFFLQSNKSSINFGLLRKEIVIYVFKKHYIQSQKKNQKVVKLRFSPLKYFAKKVKTVKNLQLTKLYRNC